VLRPHGDGLRVDAVAEVLPPAFLGWQALGKLTSSLYRLTLAARVRYDLFDVFSPYLRRVVADVYDVGLPVEADISYVRLSLQGPFDSGGATEAVYAPQLEH
jgi:hypothetical protein